MATTNTTAQQYAPNQTPVVPVYKGLMGGNYDTLQTSLATKGNLAAKNAYELGTQNLNNTMGGRGLYGSSVMQQQQTRGLEREYMNALAANESQAAAKRYELQANDAIAENQFNADIYKSDNTANTARYGVDQGQKYVADQGLLANTADNRTKMALGMMNNDTALRKIAADAKAAVDAGDMTLAENLVGGAKWLLGKDQQGAYNFNNILNGATNMGNTVAGWFDWGNSIGNYWDDATY